MNIIDQKFFEPERWLTAIEKGVDKHISKTELRALTRPEVRIAVYNCVMSDNYEIAPPHTALIPKDEKGKFRTVYINENVDRIFLSILNDLLFELFPDMIHPNCKSYQSGIGCGKIVKEIVTTLGKLNEAAQAKKYKGYRNVLGFKSDLSKYFDSVPLKYIDAVFNEIESRVGKSKVISVARKYYHTDLYFDTDGNLCEGYQSLKQGCALASFLADAILYDLDETLTKLAKPEGIYVRYSDDILFLGRRFHAAESVLHYRLQIKGLKLNPKKFEYVYYNKWFKFLGFNICGNLISLSKSRIKTFQKEIEKRTLKRNDKSLAKAVNAVNKYLYSGEYSWATSVLPIINVENDIREMNSFVLDCLRAVPTNKRKVGGLGVVTSFPDRTIPQRTGEDVLVNTFKVGITVQNYLSLNKARNAILQSRAVYNALVRQL